MRVAPVFFVFPSIHAQAVGGVQGYDDLAPFCFPVLRSIGGISPGRAGATTFYKCRLVACAEDLVAVVISACIEGICSITVYLRTK